MPKVSRDSAPQRQEAGPVVDLRDELDGYTVTFTSLVEDIDATPFMKGLPDDRCQCPHWGYVIKGKMTARYADRDEVFEAGDAFYTPPGHVPVTNEPGTEFVSFSPSEELQDGRGGHDEEHAGDAGRLIALGEGHARDPFGRGAVLHPQHACGGAPGRVDLSTHGEGVRCPRFD